MQLKGKLKHHNIFINCSVLISNGKIYEIDIDKVGAYDLILSIKDFSSDYVLEKNIDIKNNPFNSNYILKWFGGEKFPSLIYLKLNWIEKCKLDFAMNETLIQSKDIKIEILKYFILAFLGFLGGKFIYDKKTIENKTPITTPKNEPTIGTKKSLETKILKMDNKKDTIIVNNLKNASHFKGEETKP
ncbi:hypothetical protein [Flavobacterium muglaense]|uniref:Uncharacterized protein n=1 Tax=Flavobacterium muglaense TaxID=2764716 RepID=A0A923N567_9FLAO|nr:hypothetical protein [Flavobacterium muglaense]MBC5839689.1 hypothetical protein [Flavobacterium muglaense]MBC5846215.1 hypothetical protein [Flavobacterium muglaense]